MKLQELVNTCLSDADIRKSGCRQIMYEELDRYSSIEELLPKSIDGVIIFVELEKNIGHWQALKRNKKVVQLPTPKTIPTQQQNTGSNKQTLQKLFLRNPINKSGKRSSH